MGEVAQYRKIVEDVFDAILEDHYSSMGEIEAYKVVDREKGHFIIILEGGRICALSTDQAFTSR